MLGDCEEKMVLISSSTSNEWPPQTQNNQIDEKGIGMNSSASRVLMEKPNQNHQQQQQQIQQVPLKCPRCDSSNTKFCYYNNYSLSQPRHFCKACKRYWTRGGTQRNVPVGGGCRKNKRVKRPSSVSEVTSSVTSSVHQTTISSNPSGYCTTLNVSPQLDLSSSAGRSVNPLFYSLLTDNHDSSELNSLAYPRFTSNGNYELHQPQMNDLGVGFSSSGLLASYTGFSSNQQIQDVIPSSNASLLSSGYINPIFGSLSSTSSSTIGSVLASSLQKQNKLVFGGLKDAGAIGNNGFHGGGLLEPYEGMQTAKDVKMEWSSTAVGNGQSNNHINQQINSSNSDQSLLWNTAWLDPSNMGSFVPSLI